MAGNTRRRANAWEGPGRALDVLRLPGGALEALADDEPDRIGVRDDPAAASPDEGQRLTPHEPGDDVQAGPVGLGPLAEAQRPSADHAAFGGQEVRGRNPAGRRLTEILEHEI